MASRSFPLRLQPRFGHHNFNRAARLRTAAVLRFICVAIAATLIPDSATVRRRLSSSDVQGMLPTGLISSPSPKARPLHLEEYTPAAFLESARGIGLDKSPDALAINRNPL